MVRYVEYATSNRVYGPLSRPGGGGRAPRCVVLLAPFGTSLLLTEESKRVCSSCPGAAAIRTCFFVLTCSSLTEVIMTSFCIAVTSFGSQSGDASRRRAFRFLLLFERQRGLIFPGQHRFSLTVIYGRYRPLFLALLCAGVSEITESPLGGVWHISPGTSLSRRRQK